MEQHSDNEQLNDNDSVSEQVESLLISGEESSRAGDSKSALAAFNKAFPLTLHQIWHGLIVVFY